MRGRKTGLQNCGGRSGRAGSLVTEGLLRALVQSPNDDAGPLGRKAVAARMRRDDGRERRIERTSVGAEGKRFSRNSHVGPFTGLARDWRADADGMKAGHVAEDSGEVLSLRIRAGLEVQA